MRTLAAALAVAVTAAPAFAQIPTASGAAAPPEVFQVLRATDKDMSCEQIGAEANVLNAGLMQQQATAAAAAEKSARGRAMLGRLGGAALSIGGQAGLMNGALQNPLGRGVFSAANQMASNAGQAGATPMATTAPGIVTPQQQRIAHLMQTYQSKSC